MNYILPKKGYKESFIVTALQYIFRQIHVHPALPQCVQTLFNFSTFRFDYHLHKAYNCLSGVPLPSPLLKLKVKELVGQLYYQISQCLFACHSSDVSSGALYRNSTCMYMYMYVVSYVLSYGKMFIVHVAPRFFLCTVPVL